MAQPENEKWMRRCLQLARCGALHAAPNPMVGAVIVHEGRIVGEGYHHHAGQPHAEVNAINAVADKALLRQSTLYVSLEPCAHYGKTPPCADLIVRCGIPRVVVGCQDPFAQVNGRGIDKLRQAGVEVTVGVLEAECRALNRAFFTLQQKHRPFVTLKWARSADGFIGMHDHRTMLSTSFTLMEVHRLRAEHQAIMVGRRTAAEDDPELNVRYWHGPNPLRVVLDARGRLNEDLHVFDGRQPTLVVTEQGYERRKLPVVYFHPDYSRNILPQVLGELARRQICTLLVEGGRELLQSFIDAGLWDEARVEIADTIKMEDGVEAPHMPAHLAPEHYTSWGVEHLVYRNEG